MGFGFLFFAMRFASLLFTSLQEKIVPLILVLEVSLLCRGQRFIDRLDDVFIVGLSEITQDFTGFLWANAGCCFNRCQQ